MVSTQNSYNLLQRRDEVGLTEVLQMEHVGYLAYSPLAFGVLSGKYLNNQKPESARVTLFPNYNRYNGQSSLHATEQYRQIARNHGLSLTQMALAFVHSRPFVTSNIIGATSIDQLSENIDSINVSLSEEILREINKVHSQIPNPAP
jgi:aryl-alcohol dehydrogenase-like predicted oxidoreductase